MAIQQIDTVTPDIGLKTVADKLNNNFTAAENAASKLVVSSPDDTTAGRVLTTGYDVQSLAGTGTIVTQDYEEGTWTPAALTGISGLTIADVPKYTRIGSRVTGSCYLQSVVKSGTDQSFTISGLPFTCVGEFGFANVYHSINLPTGSYFTRAYVEVSSNFINFYLSQSIPDGTVFDLMIHFDYTIS